ncbi:hypothetical protein C2G38_2242736 [Gigaspora rosea]|uniref:MARVEL domain-containing protein n=1 Tax=Gigaspora rosea TaxID=44941 RepID=A0A397VTR4_9GLOM|nr:hypothetical protein C2G38_2242736 [Gigaspora rosea]
MYYYPINNQFEFTPDLPIPLTLVITVTFVILALISVFGLVSAFYKAPGATRLYSIMLWGFVMITFLISIIVINSVAQNKQNDINICVKKFQSQTDSESTIKNTTSTTDIIELCQEEATAIIIHYGLFMIAVILFMIYFAGAVNRYASQLEAEYSRYDHSTSRQE